MGQRLLSIPSRLDPWVYAVLVGLAAFSVYLRTLAPTVMWYDMGEFATTSAVLGIAHNTGYPLYILLGKLFTFLPVGDVAFRVNLMSAVFAALTVAVVFLIIHDLTGNRLAALIGSLTVAFSSTFWSNATWAESYPLNSFLMASVTLMLLRWRQRGRGRELNLAFLAFGLGMANHRLIVLLVPGILLFLWSGRHDLSAGRLARCGLFFLLGLSVYIYLPLRGSQHPPLSWAQPANFHTYLDMFLRGGSTGNFWGFDFWNHLNILTLFPLNELTPFGLAFAAVGLIYAWQRQRLFALYGLSLCLLVAVVGLTYRIHNIYNYFIPAYLMLGVLVGCGAHAILSLVTERAAVGRLQVAHAGYSLVLPAAALFLLLPAFLLARNLPLVDRSDDHNAHDFALTTLDRVKPNATIVTDSWTASPFWYVQLVEGYRKDVIVSPAFSAQGEDVNDFIAEQFANGRPVYVAEGLRVNLQAIQDKYYLQPVVLDSIESMVSNTLPKPRYKDDLAPKGSFYRVLEEKPVMTVDEVPAAARLSLPFGDGVTLAGFQADPVVAKRGDVVRFEYYWLSSAKTGGDLQATVLFTDENGLVEMRRGFPLWWQNWQLGGGVYPTSEWQPGQIIREEYFVLVPRNLKPGSYGVQLRLRQGPLASPSDASGDSIARTVGELTAQ